MAQNERKILPSETVERVFLDELEYQFLYPEEGSYVLWTWKHLTKFKLTKK